MMFKNVFAISAMLLCLLVQPVSAGTVEQDQALMLYSDGRSLVLDGEYVQAIAIFENMIELYPESSKIPNAWFYIGYSHEQLRNDQEAFKKYKFITDNYDANLVVFRKAANRATELARRLSTSVNDEYSRYLKKLVQRNNAYNDNTNILAAVNLAEEGNWSGEKVLLTGLQNAPIPVQIKISEMLIRRYKEPEVAEAFRKAIKRNAHPIVRYNAVKALSRLPSDRKNLDIMIELVENEPDEVVRAVAAHTLLKQQDEPEVKEALQTFLSETKSPRGLSMIGEKLIIRNEGSEYREALKSRLWKEENPAIKYTITSLINEELNEEENIMIWRELSDNPKAEIRLNALRKLKENSENPGATMVFLERVQKDPDSQVKVTAMSGLKGKAGQEDVQTVIVDVMKESKDPMVVSTSVTIIGDHVNSPRVKQSLIEQLQQIGNPMVVGHITRTLMRAEFDELIASAITGFLTNDNKTIDAKISMLRALDKEKTASIHDELRQIADQSDDQHLKQAINEILK